jgi:hypothetical protein
MFGASPSTKSKKQKAGSVAKEKTTNPWFYCLVYHGMVVTVHSIDMPKAL